MKLFKTTFVFIFSALLLSMVSCNDGSQTKDPQNQPQDQNPIIVENEDGTTFTVTPADLAEAVFSISEDKKTITLGGKKTDVADVFDPETYTLTGTFYGKIVVTKPEVEIVLSEAKIENENGPAITGNVKTFITAKEGTTNSLISKGEDTENDKSAAVLIQDASVEFGGKGKLNVEGSILHGVKAKKIELKGSGTYSFQGTTDGSALNCNSLKVKEEKEFTANISNSKNGIKADNTIDIASGTFNFSNLKTALKTDTSKDDKEGEVKEHYIHLTGGTFNYDSTVEKFTSTEKGNYTSEGATINSGE